jgi:hypothetical protein
MKNKGLIYILLAGGAAILLLSMRRKAPSYTIDVPAPEKITAEEFEKPSLIQRVIKAVKKVAPVVKKAAESAKQRKIVREKTSAYTSKQRKAAKQTAAALSKGLVLRGIGQFPDMC